MDMATGDSPLLSKQANLQAGLPPSKQLQSEESRRRRQSMLAAEQQMGTCRASKEGPGRKKGSSRRLRPLMETLEGADREQERSQESNGVGDGRVPST